MATRKDVDKLDWGILPTEALEEIIRVMMFGEVKYGRDDWKSPPYFANREVVTNSLKRHTAKIEKGERFDEESGLLHSAHKAANALFELYYDIYRLWGGTQQSYCQSICTPDYLVENSHRVWKRKMNKRKAIKSTPVPPSVKKDPLFKRIVWV